MSTMARLALYLVVILFGLASHTFGQAPQTGVRGSVRDEIGGVLPGARVTATNQLTGAASSVVCDDRGAYALAQLTPGTYTVQAMLPGFRSDASDVTVVAGEMRTRDITLVIAPLTETVTVTRTDQELSTVPAAVNVILEDEIQMAQRKASLNETLRAIPGVFVQDRVNYSESFGVRLSIRAPVRGVGIGVRGLQLLQDDIPLTMADGTTQPTNVDLGSMGEIEVIRGPSSVLYGNSAGGVITLRTQTPSSRPFVVQPDVQYGSSGYERQQVKTTGTVGRVGYLFNVSRMKTDGYREHSRADVRLANMVIHARLSPSTELRGMFNLFDMPFGQSPGTLTLDDARNRPRSARQLVFDQGLGESSTQGQGGLTLVHRFASGQALRTTGWGMWRSVWNPIPFRIIDLGRSGSGVRLEYSGATRLGTWAIAWATGVDSNSQRDDSVERRNAGVIGDTAQAGDRLVDQLEHVRSIGPFAHVSLTPRPRWTLTAGLRYDHYNFRAADRLLADGDQSGSRTLSAFSPTAGISYGAARGFNVYGSFATAYETPTLQELSNRPTGEGGFNMNLEPQDLRTFEAGARGLLQHWRLNYDIAGYVSTLKNALVRYQREDEVEYFLNAGQSSRNGIEALLEWKPGLRVVARLVYTYQRFVFDRFTADAGNFAGKREPGAPPQQLMTSLTGRTPFGLIAMVQFRWTDAYPVNDANTFSNWASKVVDLRVAWNRRWTRLDLGPYIGVDNLFDERYNGSTVPNSFGNRFFEPAPGRQIYAGLRFGTGAK